MQTVGIAIYLKDAKNTLCKKSGYFYKNQKSLSREYHFISIIYFLLALEDFWKVERVMKTDNAIKSIIMLLLFQLMLLFCCDIYELGLLARVISIPVYDIYLYILKPLSISFFVVPFYVYLFTIKQVNIHFYAYLFSIVYIILCGVFTIFNLFKVITININLVSVYIYSLLNSFFFAIILYKKLFRKWFLWRRC